MWINTLDPVLVHLGPLEIRWYGLVYVMGFFLAIAWLKYVQKKGLISLSRDEIWDFVFYMMLGVLIGSRLFMIFWNPEIYLFNPLNLLKIWEGGMSFHGGLVGIVTAAYLYCKKKKLPFWKLADVMSVPTIFVLSLGRLANFVNGELVGRVWNGRWCVVFPDYGQECRHPNMIYSFFQRLAVFGWLYFLNIWQEFKPGFIFWNLVFWEGIGRFIMDFFREDTLYLGLSLGQWFSVIMVVIAAWMFWRHYKDDWKTVYLLRNGKAYK